MIGGLSYGVRRGGKIVLSVATMVVAAIAIVEDTNLLRYAIAGYYFVGGVLMVGLLTLPTSYTMGMYKIHDLVVGHLIFLVLFLMSALQFPQHVQTWLLYHNALSSDVVIEDILKYSRRSQEKEGGRGDGDVDSQVEQLRAMIMKQDLLLKKLIEGKVGEGVEVEMERNESTDALAVLVSDSNDNSVMRELGKDRDPGGRVMSMSNLSIYQSMATGDGGDVLGAIKAGMNVVASGNATTFTCKRCILVLPRGE